jgi:hypothetical protein
VRRHTTDNTPLPEPQRDNVQSPAALPTSIGAAAAKAAALAAVVVALRRVVCLVAVRWCRRQVAAGVVAAAMAAAAAVVLRWVVCLVGVRSRRWCRRRAAAGWWRRRRRGGSAGGLRGTGHVVAEAAFPTSSSSAAASAHQTPTRVGPATQPPSPAAVASLARARPVTPTAVMAVLLPTLLPQPPTSRSPGLPPSRVGPPALPPSLAAEPPPPPPLPVTSHLPAALQPLQPSHTFWRWVPLPNASFATPIGAHKNEWCF